MPLVYGLYFISSFTKIQAISKLIIYLIATGQMMVLMEISDATAKMEMTVDFVTFRSVEQLTNAFQPTILPYPSYFDLNQ